MAPSVAMVGRWAMGGVDGCGKENGVVSITSEHVTASWGGREIMKEEDDQHH